MDDRDKNEGAPDDPLQPEPGRGAENPLDQRRAHQDRGLARFPDGDQPEPGQRQGHDEPDDGHSIRSAGEGDLRFRERP